MEMSEKLKEKLSIFIKQIKSRDFSNWKRTIIKTNNPTITPIHRGEGIDSGATWMFNELAPILEEMREALEKYADKAEWHSVENCRWKLRYNSGKIDGDGYEDARRALEKYNEVMK